VETTFAQTVVDLARSVGASLAVVETVTSGLVGQKLASCSAAADAYRGAVQGIAAVDAVLGVSLESRQGGPDEARQLAALVRERLGATHGVAVLGAPPDRDEEGSLWVGICGPAGTRCRHYDYAVDRERWRVLAAYVALGQLRRTLMAASG
jgi:nicotinamide-nucleotide amidase